MPASSAASGDAAQTLTRTEQLVVICTHIRRAANSNDRKRLDRALESFHKRKPELEDVDAIDEKDPTLVSVFVKALNGRYGGEPTLSNISEEGGADNEVSSMRQEFPPHAPHAPPSNAPRPTNSYYSSGQQQQQVSSYMPNGSIGVGVAPPSKPPRATTNSYYSSGQQQFSRPQGSQGFGSPASSAGTSLVSRGVSGTPRVAQLAAQLPEHERQQLACLQGPLGGFAPGQNTKGFQATFGAGVAPRYFGMVDLERLAGIIDRAGELARVAPTICDNAQETKRGLQANGYVVAADQKAFSVPLPPCMRIYVYALVSSPTAFVADVTGQRDKPAILQLETIDALCSLLHDYTLVPEWHEARGEMNPIQAVNLGARIVRCAILEGIWQQYA